MSFYPIYLTKLDQKQVVLVGGNHEAERKCNELIEFQVNLKVISPSITEKMHHLHQEGKFHWVSRRYREGDLEDASLAIAAEYDGDTGVAFAAEAHIRNIPVNVMDNIPLSNFAFGTLVKKGNLIVSMSSNGLAPALIVRLKERLNRELDDAYAEFLALAEQIRGPVIHRISDFDEKKKKWYAWVDSETINLLRNGERAKALEVTESIWGSEIMSDAGLRLF